MATPSGWRSSAPVPVPSIRGMAPSRAAKVVIRIGRSLNSAAWWMAVRGSLPSVRSASRAKSIIMIAFLLTMPISRMMPMIPTIPRSMWPIIRATRAPIEAEGRVDRMVMGWMKLS